MGNESEYRLTLGNINPNDLNAISDLICKNADKFENFVLSSISDSDSRYSYDSYNFEITYIDEGSFNFSAPYTYYEGCVDNDFSSSVEGSIEYEIIDGELVFTLNELDWDVC